MIMTFVITALLIIPAAILILVGDQVGDLLDQLALLHHVGNFADHQLPHAIAEAFDAILAVSLILGLGGVEAGADAEGALAALVGRRNRRGAAPSWSSSGSSRLATRHNSRSTPRARPGPRAGCRASRKSCSISSATKWSS